MCLVARPPGPKSQEHLARVGPPFLASDLKFKVDKYIGEGRQLFFLSCVLSLCQCPSLCIKPPSKSGPKETIGSLKNGPSLSCHQLHLD